MPGVAMVEARLTGFDPGAIARSGQCFRMEPAGDAAFDVVALGRRLRLEDAGGGVFRFGCEQDVFEAVWRPYFDLDTDYARFGAQIPSEDLFLQSAFHYGRGLRILRQEPWETLVTFVISQNNNIARIRGSVSRLCERFGERCTDALGAFFNFPAAQALATAGEDGLRACGLGYRAPYVAALATAVADGALDPAALAELPDAALREALLRLTGIGPKVAQCVMLFGYHRMDAFPVDVWVHRALKKRYPQGFPSQRYAGFAGVMQQYIFFYERALAGKGSAQGGKVGNDGSFCGNS